MYLCIAVILLRCKKCKTVGTNYTERDRISIFQHRRELKFKKSLCRFEVNPCQTWCGLVVRPKATSSTERAFKLKRKYKRMSRQAARYKSGYKPLQTNEQCPRGRPRHNACYRNRVGKKAGLKRKVTI